MVKLPASLASYRQAAKRSLHQDVVKDIEFSDATYQVLVEDAGTHEKFWVFLQLDDKGEIRDAFCSGEENPEESCVHLAIAYLSLYQNYDLPLHQRFTQSLWNRACRLYADRIKHQPENLTRLTPDHYVFRDPTERLLFSIQAKTPEASEHLDEILFRRPIQTEETSLKFSNLTPEELTAWREGRPTLQLKYDLSYWSDLAKWLMSMQESQVPYRITFSYPDPLELPNWIEIAFETLVLGFALQPEDLPEIIPALTTVNSPLKVENAYHQSIQEMVYDVANGVLHVYAQDLNIAKEQPQYSSGIPLAHGNWVFIPGEGFYSEEPHILLKTPLLSGTELSEALIQHGHFIAAFLKNEMVHFDPVDLSYQLIFDKNWNLHIKSYVFEMGDLTKGYSRLIDNWIYLEGKGFYPLKQKRFEAAETVIPIQHISDFITDNRAWLNSQEGFETHVSSLEYQMSYQVSSEGRLTFQRTLTHSKENVRIQDFGAWVYVEGTGFYSKNATVLQTAIRPELSLSSGQIPLFIRMNRSELALVPGFFSDRCPILQVGMKLSLDADLKTLHIHPDYSLLSSYHEKSVRFFDDVVYTPGEGFYELPSDLRLPERFHHAIDLQGEEFSRFLKEELEHLDKWIIEIDPRLVSPKQQRLVIKSLALAKEKGRGWYQLTLFYQTERGLIPVEAIWKALKKRKQAFAFFQGGRLTLSDHRYDWLRSLKADRFESAQGLVFLTTLELMRLNAFDSILLLEGEGNVHASSQVLLDELIHFQPPSEPDLKGLLSHLRPYQEVGVRWLWFLYHQQLSGLLCDDMGLGKTHQAMGLIVSIMNLYRSYAEGSTHHFLIVCPTSVLYHWQEKLQQFLPHAKIHIFYGTKRTLEAFEERYDILLTSYGILRNEQEALAKIPFEVAIFDEIQIAKNQLSRIYAALVRIQAHMKLGLTGTPIENHLRELKSLFDIILPAYMPSETQYREFFVKSIEKENNFKRRELLNRLIHPFVLRRKKEMVLLDLPEKVEEIAHCDLAADQFQLYTQVLQQRRQLLMEDLQDERAPVPYLHVFSLLSSLKQICDHPAVYLKRFHEYRHFGSGKWELFKELLREARESQQKVVVFSQYLGMLDIIEHYLQEHHIEYATIRGATHNRQEQLQRFNHEAGCEVFVGSLQAAGLGIDLTAGSVVIHYDRWWNAARENQATDRVHRIGQTRGVQVFKLVTRGTFEERIDAMIARKGKLMEEVVGVDEQSTLKVFSREELMQLLQLAEGSGQDLSVIDLEESEE